MNSNYMISLNDVACITRSIPRDVIVYEIQPRTVLSNRSYLGLYEAIVSFPVEAILPGNIFKPKHLLGRACQMGHIDIVRILLADPRVDPSDYDNFAIRKASQYGRFEVVKLLLADPRVDPTVYDNKAIRWASRYGRLEVVDLLLADSRVDPSDYDNKAIRWASANGHFEIVKLLLADPRVDASSAAYASLSDHSSVV